MFFKRSPFQFAFKNSFIHKIDQDFILLSENNEEIDDYAAQDLEIMNTKEATAYFCSFHLRLTTKVYFKNCLHFLGRPLQFRLFLIFYALV